MLLFHQGLFIQALEGPKDVVESLYYKISEDKRQTETRGLFRGELKKEILTIGLWVFIDQVKQQKKI